jgi:hypothetical protein
MPRVSALLSAFAAVFFVAFALPGLAQAAPPESHGDATSQGQAPAGPPADTTATAGPGDSFGQSHASAQAPTGDPAPNSTPATSGNANGHGNGNANANSSGDSAPAVEPASALSTDKSSSGNAKGSPGNGNENAGNGSGNAGNGSGNAGNGSPNAGNSQANSGNGNGNSGNDNNGNGNGDSGNGNGNGQAVGHSGNANGAAHSNQNNPQNVNVNVRVDQPGANGGVAQSNDSNASALGAADSATTEVPPATPTQDATGTATPTAVGPDAAHTSGVSVSDGDPTADPPLRYDLHRFGGSDCRLDSGPADEPQRHGSRRQWRRQRPGRSAQHVDGYGRRREQPAGRSRPRSAHGTVGELEFDAGLADEPQRLGPGRQSGRRRPTNAGERVRGDVDDRRSGEGHADGRHASGSECCEQRRASRQFELGRTGPVRATRQPS